MNKISTVQTASVCPTTPLRSIYYIYFEYTSLLLHFFDGYVYINLSLSITYLSLQL